MVCDTGTLLAEKALLLLQLSAFQSKKWAQFAHLWRSDDRLSSLVFAMATSLAEKACAAAAAAAAATSHTETYTMICDI